MEENLLEVVKKQKELNDLKSAFVNMVSHELRTPLAVISSGAEIMQMMLQAGRPKEDMEVYTKQIINEVEKMTAFMNDLLMVSKIEAGKIDFRPERVSLEQFIKELAAERYMPWKDGRQLSVQSKGLLREIGIDKKMFRHALQNVVENAFKYSSGKAAPRLHIRYSNTYFTISVADNGIGILSTDIKELFTSFTRGKNTGNIPGTGIGLVVVKYFIEQHGGFVAVKSKAGEGAVFMIKIPYLPA
jgi:signal transduction histidine kinase